VRTIVVIPTYNERPNLARLVPAILDANVDSTIDVLVVDDASPDGTGELAEMLAEANPAVHVIHRQGKLGLGTAYLAGFQYALRRGYDLVVEMDADFSHRPEDLPALIAAARGADVVIGSRWVRGGKAVGWSPLRRLLSEGGSLYARWLLDLPVLDCTSGFKCFRRSALETLDLDAIHSSGYAFQVEVNYLCRRNGLRLAEVPITFPDRAEGESKMSLRIVLEAWWLVLASAVHERTGMAGHKHPLAPTSVGQAA